MWLRVFLGFGAALALSAQTPGRLIPGRYVVEFEGEPLATFRQSLAKEASERAAQSVQDHTARIRGRHAAARSVLAARNVKVRGTIETVGNAIAVEGATEEQLRDLPGVKRIVPVRMLRAHMDRAFEILRFNEAWSQLGGPANAGAGVKIGIIDTGIDTTHQAFSDPTMTAPTGFPIFSSESNRALTSGKVIVARSYEGTARDCEGHGTGVAMAAAGVRHTALGRSFSGVAPKAWLGAYRASASCEGEFPVDNVELAIEDAVKDGMDIINLSLGAPGLEVADEAVLTPYLNRAAAAGVIIVTAIGNDGPEVGTIGDTAIPSAIGVGATNSDQSSGPSVIFANSVFTAAAATNSSTAAPVTAPLSDISSFDSTRLGCTAYPAGTSLRDRIAVVQRGSCDFAVKFANAAQAGAIAILVYNNIDESQLSTMIADNAAIPGIFVSQADGQKVRELLVSNPDTPATLNFFGEFPDDPTKISDFSSRGPTADLGIKPDLVATGTLRTATFNTGAANRYVVAEGTSLSSPIVAGAAALVKQFRPGLGVAQYHSLLTNSATAIPGGPLEVGAGLLNIPASLTNNAVLAPVNLSFGAFNPASASREFTVTNIGKGSEIFTARVAAQDPVAPTLSTTDFALAPGASQRLTLRFEGTPGPGAHQGAIEITGSNGSSARLPYWMGVRSTEPKRISLVYIPPSAGAGERITIFFRLVDDSFLSFDTGNPDIEVVSGGGTVSTVQYAGSIYPGVFAATVRLGRIPGVNAFKIKAGAIEREIRVRGGN